MAVLIGSANINEFGELEGGKPGDQTGKEVTIQNWYLHSKGWFVIRAIDPLVRKKIAENMRNICANNNVGYSYWDNCMGLLNESKKYGYDASKVKIKVDTNCAKSVVVCIRYAGVNVDDFHTGSEIVACQKTNAFYILKEDAFCKSSDYLLEGDILVTRTKGHTVVVLSDGAKAANVVPYEIFNCVHCNLRKGPTVNYKKIVGLDSGDTVLLYGWASSGWGLVLYKDFFGYVSPMYLKQWTKVNASYSTWLRDKAGKDIGAQIISISKGTNAYISGKTTKVGNTTWYNTFYKGREGWASSLYLKVVK